MNEVGGIQFNLLQQTAALLPVYVMYRVGVNVELAKTIRDTSYIYFGSLDQSKNSIN
jgi:hypothetical protein